MRTETEGKHVWRKVSFITGRKISEEKCMQIQITFWRCKYCNAVVMENPYKKKKRKLFK